MVMGLIFIAMGLAALAVGVAGFRGRRSAKRTGTKLPGTVVSEQKSHSRGSYSYFPTVRFTTPDGRSMEQASSWGDSRSRLGEPIDVWYMPGKPIWIDDSSNSTSGTMVAGATGLVFVAVGIALASGHLHR